MTMNEFMVGECIHINESGDRWARLEIHPQIKNMYIGVKNSNGEREIPYKIRHYISLDGRIDWYDSLMS